MVYVALAGENEPQAIHYLSHVGESCEAQAMPLIAEAEYPNAYQSLDRMNEDYGPDYLLRNARLCAELGADDRPVVLAGGSRLNDEELLARMYHARQAGAVGCSVGRNVFQRANPRAMTRALSRIFRDGWEPRAALDELAQG